MNAADPHEADPVLTTLIFDPVLAELLTYLLDVQIQASKEIDTLSTSMRKVLNDLDGFVSNNIDHLKDLM